MNVKVISRKNGKAVIQWTEEDILRRAVVPSGDVSESGYIEHPEYGLEYAFPFSEYINIEVTPADLERALNNAGVWTLEDIFTRPAEVQGAINGAYGAVYQNLLRNMHNLRNVGRKP